MNVHKPLLAIIMSEYVSISSKTKLANGLLPPILEIFLRHQCSTKGTIFLKQQKITGNLYTVMKFVRRPTLHTLFTGLLIW